MYPLGFTGLIECRLLNIFEPGVCPVWIMWVQMTLKNSTNNISNKQKNSLNKPKNRSNKQKK